MRPSVYVSPEGIAKIRNIWKKFDSGVGFSNGCALFALKKPPPFVPNILMASCEAAGPRGIICCVIVCVAVFPSEPWVWTDCGSRSCAVAYGFRFCTTPCEIRKSDPTRQTGSSTHKKQRVRSTQKFPMVPDSRRVIPRIRAIASAIPTAADAKLW